MSDYQEMDLVEFADQYAKNTYSLLAHDQVLSWATKQGYLDDIFASLEQKETTKAGRDAAARVIEALPVSDYTKKSAIISMALLEAGLGDDARRGIERAFKAAVGTLWPGHSGDVAWHHIQNYQDDLRAQSKSPVVGLMQTLKSTDTIRTVKTLRFTAAHPLVSAFIVFAQDADKCAHAASHELAAAVPLNSLEITPGAQPG